VTISGYGVSIGHEGISAVAIAATPEEAATRVRRTIPGLPELPIPLNTIFEVIADLGAGASTF
jgi:hypothetical protein